MGTLSAVQVVALGVVLVGSWGCSSPKVPADLVIRNAAVYTLDAARPSAQAVAVRDGILIYVGDNAGVTQWMGPGTEIFDAKGGTLLPGLVDSHIHPISSIELMGCDLTNDSTPARILATIQGCGAAHPNDAWVRGTGWQLPVFPNANPTAALLDQVVRDRPAYLSAADGHSAWVNSRALKLAGITRATPDPENGLIEHDASGNPSGTLRESAVSLVERLLPPYTSQEYISAFRQALELANQVGITAIIEANADSAMLAAYHVMDSAGTLTARVTAAQELDLDRGPRQIARLIRLR
ncbi:MAG: amidohydrolase family protein, partial [Gemmatimonadota bacterium]